MVKATGITILDGSLSLIEPNSGARRIENATEVKMSLWYSSFDLASVMRPSSAKLVSQSTKKFEKRTAISFNIETPKKQIMYLESPRHSAQADFKICMRSSLPAYYSGRFWSLYTWGSYLGSLSSIESMGAFIECWRAFYGRTSSGRSGEYS